MGNIFLTGAIASVNKFNSLLLDKQIICCYATRSLNSIPTASVPTEALRVKLLASELVVIIVRIGYVSHKEIILP